MTIKILIKESAGYGVFFIGLLVFSLGVNSFKLEQKYNDFDLAILTNLKERQFAQEQALKDGRKEYTFTTGFIPGIGYIGDGKAFQQEQMSQLQELIKNATTIPGGQ